MKEKAASGIRAVRFLQLAVAARLHKDQLQMHAAPTSPPLRLLVVVANAPREKELRHQLAMLCGDRRLQLHVVAPAFARSKLKYFTSDADEGIKRLELA